MNKYLIHANGIRVITPDVMIASELSSFEGIEVFVLGGKLRKGYYTLTGSFAINNLVGIQFDTAFLSCDAINISNGCMLTNMEEVELKKKIIVSSRETVVLCDHTKFDKSSFMSYCTIDQVDHLIVGNKLDEDIYIKYANRGVNITRI